jgi:hypothetical protein
MLQILEKFYSKVLVKETFEDDKDAAAAPNHVQPSILPSILALATILILQLLLGKYLWNNFLVNAFTIVKPLESIIDLIALSFLFKLLSN